MGDVIDPSRASIDGLIDWLRERRARDPGAKLADLLSSHQFEPDRLVDLACIDLIQRRRMGHAVTVETYLEEFPTLAGEAARLDLIDAEICVASELGGHPQVELYVDRFPDLSEQIRELVQLEGAAPAIIDSALNHLADSHRCSQDTTNQSAEFSIEPALHSPGLRGDFANPVDVPDWFVSEKCIASSPGRWLIQGRDSKRGVALALKVIELPTELTAAEHEEILDACEHAARVRNQAWVIPSVAAIQNRRLAVIRPWVFAHAWHQSAVPSQRETELRFLASAAFAIQSAHDAGATHGGVQAENLLVDHTGNLRIVDAICNSHGIARWLRCPEKDRSPGRSTHQSRMNLDAQSLIKLIVAASVDWTEPWANQLAVDLRNVADGRCDDACARIGELLIRRADNDVHSSTQNNSPANRDLWPVRLTRWLRGV